MYFLSYLFKEHWCLLNISQKKIDMLLAIDCLPECFFGFCSLSRYLVSSSAIGCYEWGPWPDVPPWDEVGWGWEGLGPSFSCWWERSKRQAADWEWTEEDRRGRETDGGTHQKSPVISESLNWIFFFWVIYISMYQLYSASSFLPSMFLDNCSVSHFFIYSFEFSKYFIFLFCCSLFIFVNLFIPRN